MELKGNIIGVIDHKTIKYDENKLVKEIIIKKQDDSLKIVKLKEDILNYSLKDLTKSELLRVILASKLYDKEIILTNFMQYFNKKDRDYFAKIFIKLNKQYHKQIILIEPNINYIYAFVDNIYYKKNHKTYQSNDCYNDELYEIIDMPEIVKFVKLANKKGNKLDNYKDINELIKAIYRSIK